MIQVRTAVFVWAVGAIAAGAAEWRVTVTPVPGTARQCVEHGTLTTTPDVDVRRDAAGDYEIRSAKPVNVRLVAKDCWSPELALRGETRAEALRIFAAGQIHGVFEGKPPKTLSAMFYVENGRRAREEAGEAQSCEVDGSKWRCNAPAGTAFDVRLQPAGYAAVYQWDVALQPGSDAAADAIPLALGSTIVGKIQKPDGRPANDAIVTLRPAERVEEAHAAARKTRARTNGSGAFQLTGIASGEYVLESLLRGYSRAQLPVRVSESGTIVLPRPLRHVALASLRVLLQPFADAAQRPWRLSLEELTAMPAVVASGDAAGGEWTARELHAGEYTLIVRSGDTILDRVPVDLTAGGAFTLPVTISSIVVEGRVLAGDKGIQADLRFTNDRAQRVTATSTEDGRFDVSLPVPGTWRLILEYPPGKPASRLDLDELEVPKEGLRDATIRIGPGAIAGDVVTREGAPVGAMVGIRRNGRLIGQQATEKDGTFEFIGLRAGVYEVEAEASTAATPIPVSVEVGEDRERVKLVVESHRVLKGIVLTPQGQPASGAALRISRNGGRTWFPYTTDVRGLFETRLPSGSVPVVIVSTYQYPSVLIPVSASDERLTIQLPALGGVLRVLADKTPWIFFNDVSAPMSVFWFPEPFGRFEGGAYLPSGRYLACPGQQRSEQCRPATLAAGARTTIDLRAPRKNDPGGE